jgi:hypothetical protein
MPMRRSVLAAGNRLLAVSSAPTLQRLLGPGRLERIGGQQV